MAMVKAVVFDSDGTLLNSFELIVSAYRHVAESHHLRPPTASEIRAQLGKSLPDILQTFYPDQDVAQLLRTNSAYIAANVTASTIFAGAHDALEALQARGIVLAILTGGNHKVVDLLEHHHLKHYFRSIVHCERITRPKPDPEGFLLATHECGVTASEAIMVGDSVADILTGKRAGAHATIGVTHGYTSRDDLYRVEPDYLVEGLYAVQQVVLSLA